MPGLEDFVAPFYEVAWNMNDDDVLDGWEAFFFFFRFWWALSNSRCATVGREKDSFCGCACLCRRGRQYSIALFSNQYFGLFSKRRPVWVIRMFRRVRNQDNDFSKTLPVTLLFFVNDYVGTFMPCDPT